MGVHRAIAKAKPVFNAVALRGSLSANECKLASGSKIASMIKRSLYQSTGLLFFWNKENVMRNPLCLYVVLFRAKRNKCFACFRKIPK